MVPEKEFNELLKSWNELNNQNTRLFNELNKTRQLVETRTEEIQEEIFTILGNMKLLYKNNKMNDLKIYIDEQYSILKKELFADYQSAK